MASFEEVYEKVLSDEGEKQTLAQALATKEGTAAFLAARDCEGMPEEFVTFLKEQEPASAESELGDGELEGAAGGGHLGCLLEDPEWVMSFSIFRCVMEKDLEPKLL